ncbi:MAG: hypothetical protein J6J11_01555 [Treponema sp.]|nr:hypothetical protein [Clostridia bacterium]MBP3606989.1 hypothetical protein [Treponema sp.]
MRKTNSNTKIKDKIIFRTTLDETIFEEMTNKYPRISSLRSNIELKQTIDFFSMPSDFNMSEFLYEAEDRGIDSYKALAVLISIINMACADEGYYSIYNRSYIDRIQLSTHINKEEIKDIIDFLTTMESPFVFIFNHENKNKITNIFSVRTFETVQSSRSRARRAATKQPEPEIVEDTETTEENNDIVINTYSNKRLTKKDKEEVGAYFLSHLIEEESKNNSRQEHIPDEIFNFDEQPAGLFD